MNLISSPLVSPLSTPPLPSKIKSRLSLNSATRRLSLNSDPQAALDQATRPTKKHLKQRSATHSHIQPRTPSIIVTPSDFKSNVNDSAALQSHEIHEGSHLEPEPTKSLKQHLLYRLFHHNETDPEVLKLKSGSVIYNEPDSDEEAKPVETSRSSYPLAVLSSKKRRAANSRNDIIFQDSTDYLRSSSDLSFSSSNTSSSIGSSRSISSIFSSLKSSGSIFHSRSNSDVADTSLEGKYGKMEKHSLGKGANSVVRLSHKKEVSINGEHCERLYAVKQFRKRHNSEDAREYIKKVTAEFCISSSLHHENVIETQNHKHNWCEVMEFCPGGDLCMVIQSTRLTLPVANCFFVQLLDGVSYIHSVGVAHRDLKPENLMLNAHGFLKITDFGESEVFRSPTEKAPHMSRKLVGSEPYMAPEEFEDAEFDPQKVDLWACAIIYIAMIHSRIPWEKPSPDDAHYQFYLKTRLLDGGAGFELIETLGEPAREVIKMILLPDPTERITVAGVIATEWFQDIGVLSKDCMERGRKEKDVYNGALDVLAAPGSCLGTSSTNLCPTISPFEIHHLRHHPPHASTEQIRQ